MRERRSDPRAPVTVTTYLARTMADGSAAVMELRSADLSAGGIFLETDDLSALDRTVQPSVFQAPRLSTPRGFHSLI